MDSSQASHQGSTNTDGSVGQWGTMGGSPGDGVGGAAVNPVGSTVPQQVQAPQQPYASPPRTTEQSQQSPYYPPGTGSITRFATPEMNAQQQQQSPFASSSPSSATGGSYAARSAQYHQQVASQQQQVQRPQPPPSAPSGGSYAARSAQAYATQPPPSQQPSYQPPAPAAATGGYAARSAQAYAQQPQQQQQQAAYSTGQQQPPPSQPAATGGYAAPSAQAYSQQQQQQPAYATQQQPTYGSPPSQQQPQPAYGSPQGQPPQQQQQQPSYPAAPPGATSGSSYAARSAQAYTTTPQQQQQQQQPPSQQPTGTMPSGGSYATRSAQAYQGTDAASMAQPSQATTGQPYAQPQQQQQAPQQPGTHPMPGAHAPAMPGTAAMGQQTPQAQAMQQRLLTDATRKVQEHAYYMRQAMDRKDLPSVLDRAALMVGELGGPPHGQHHYHHGSGDSKSQTNTGASAKLSPKNYYELYMRALEDMPSFEEYLFNLVTQPVPPDTIQVVETAPLVRQKPYKMRELYDCVQYCPRVVSRLYLQAAAASALIRSEEMGAKWVLNDLTNSVKCEQNPIRGLFLRHFLLQVLRDKLPDGPAPAIGAPTLTSIPSEEQLEEKLDVEIDEKDKGTVKDSYEFVLANFMEMNKLWVRIQHLPGEGKNKDVRKRRERERNELRILVGTNLVRLSQLEGVTSKIYGEVILPQILDHIVVQGDPLSQAYLMDCLVQVFPDEYHIETLPILLNVCPRLRDKVNIRTILQGLMDRLANYLADEELLDESDTNQVKKALARDSFGMFEDCVQKVYNARGPKLTSKEVIRLQTALLQFSLKCYSGNMEQINRCLGVCSTALRQANASYEAHEGTVASVPVEMHAIKPLDEASVTELEKLLSIPLDSLALKVLQLDNYSELIGFLPWNNRRQVAITMLQAIDNSGVTPQSVKEIEELFCVIEPVIRDENVASANVAAHDPTGRAADLMAGLGVTPQRSTSFGASFNENDPERRKDAAKLNALVSKLVHLLDNEDTDVVFEMLGVARTHICKSDRQRTGQMLVALVFATLRLGRRVFYLEQEMTDDETKEASMPPKAESGGEPTSERESNPEPPEPKDESKPEPSGPKDESKPEPSEPMEDTPPETTVDVGPASETNEETPAEEGQATESSPVAESSADATEAQTAEPKTGEDENGTKDGQQTKTAKSISSRKVFIFLQETISTIGRSNPETAVKLYLESALTADSFSVATTSTTLETTDFIPIAYELVSQSYSLYEETITESKAQQRCISSMIGTLLALHSLSKEDYESLITKTAQFSAKVMKKPDQCQLVALCAYLFYPVCQGDDMLYSNPQRALECLQRSLKLADACTSANPSNLYLFVDLLEHYVYFFEKKNPVIRDAYITGLIALIKEHVTSTVGDSSEIVDAKVQFMEVIRHIKRKKTEEGTSEIFASIQVDNIGA